ncbi:MAG: double-strand break repair helicase AddA [Brevundimonas sp.]
MTSHDPQALAADPSVNAFVMANAGSGKTTTLVSRVARLLLGGSRPDAVLCLTFTKAAAAEMQRRLYERLGKWAVSADAELRDELGRLEQRDPAAYGETELSRARTLFAHALETPGGLKIQTIHAFCEQLLRRFPIEAGVSPLFRVVDDIEAEAIRSRARDRVAERSLAGDPGLSEAYETMAGRLDFQAFEAMFVRFEEKRAAMAAWVAADGGPATLVQRIATMVGIERLEDPDAVELAAVTPPVLDLDNWFAAAGALAGGNEKTDRPMGLKVQAIAEAIRSGDAPVQAVKRLFFTADGEGGPRARMATKAVHPATVEWLADEQARLAEAVSRARACRVGWDTLHAVTLAGAYAAEYEAAKAARGALDFADLISAALKLLTDQESGAAWVLFKLDGGVDHILVDEAQDTSPEQWGIVRALTDEFFRGAGSRESGVERTLFVVGDEKQSIFSFQGAAPERLLFESQSYRRLIEGVDRRFENVQLLQSWRSTPEVLAFVDKVFFDADRAQALSPGRGLIGDRVDARIEHVAARSDGPGTIDIWEAEQEDATEERRAWDEPMDADLTRGARRRVADRIVAEVRSLVRASEGVHDKDSRQWRAADWGDVLILVKKRGPMFEEILRALKQGGVPVAGADRLKLSEHAVFQDLLALGRAALFPEDDLTLAGVLRSPLCDVPEDGLYAIAQGRSGSLWRALRTHAETGLEAREAVALIAGFRAAARDRTPFDLYAGLLNRVDVRGLTMRQRFLTRLGGEAGDAIDAFLDQAQAAEMRGVLDLERFCHGLSTLTQTVKREMDEPRGEVRVMTTHSSKGLEAPIVILPDTIFEEPKGDALLEVEDGGFLWCGSAKADCEASAVAREARKRRNEEESLRLLYVGLTRARDRLIVGGRYASNRKLENIRAWWGPLDEAVRALGDEVRVVEGPHGVIRRYGADPVARPRALATTRAEVVAPGWLGRGAEDETVGRVLSPSRMSGLDGAPAPSPLARTGPGGTLGRFRRGDLIHRLLERLPDIDVEDRPHIAARLLSRERDLDEDQRAEMIGSALEVLGDARFAPVFGPGSRPEVALTGQVNGATVSGRMDRLVITPERVLVVDYKSNRPAPARVEDADPAYVLQLAVYVSILRHLYPRHTVDAALVWTDGPQLMPVPAAMLDAALMR